MALQRPSTVVAGQSSLRTLLKRIIAERAIYPVFQPIVDLATHEVVGVEALARGPAGSPLEFPDVLFAEAIAADLLTDLDQLCFARALETARDGGALTPPLVFVNAEPAGLNRPMSPELAAVVLSDLPFRIVLEFTERALTRSPASLLRLSDLVHRAGNAIALDDVGADPVSLAFLPLVEPEVVKLDMHLVRNPYAADTHSTAAAVAAYASRSGATVLAEGIETPEDAANAQSLGAAWGQGWLFGRPGPLEALLGRQGGTSRLSGISLPRSETDHSETPFTIASRQHPVRVANREMTYALIDHVVAATLDRKREGIVLCAVNELGQASRWLPRLTAAGEAITYLGLLGQSAVSGDGAVQTQELDVGDPLRAETVIAVLTESYSIALCMKAPRTDGPNAEANEFVLSQNREVVQAVVRNMLRRFRTW